MTQVGGTCVAQRLAKAMLSWGNVHATPRPLGALERYINHFLVLERMPEAISIFSLKLSF